MTISASDAAFIRKSVILLLGEAYLYGAIDFEAARSKEGFAAARKARGAEQAGLADALLAALEAKSDAE